MSSKKNDWDRIAAAHQAFLVRQAEQRIPKRYWSKIDPNSAVQDALVRAIAAKQQFEGTLEQERSYLLRVLLSAILDRLRKIRRKLRDADREVPLLTERGSESPQLALSSRASPERKAQSRQALGRALDRLERLPTDQRAVLKREVLDNLAHDAIASELGLSIEAVKVLSRRGHRQLRKYAGQHEQ